MTVAARDRAARPVAMLVHQEDASAGLVGEWLDARDTGWVIVRPDDPEPDPTTPEAIISLGSSHSAYASEPAWIPRQRRLLRAALNAGTPVLGICFGAQALALAAGGDVTRAEQPEVGWVEPDSRQPELRGPWLAWHFDSIALPPGAVELARSSTALQAFRLGRSLGLQFHPEVTPGIWNGWSSREPEIVRRHAGDPDHLQAGVHEREAELRTRVFALLDWWWRAVLAG